ncbi:MAG: hypothetical protein KatS3mg115_2289 [Candidatus Poribacteria bacterium]|nr:MAG: hypothetical protein KatS3mg115_2289 [Candidatus Poribacteria bacterium]
MQSYTQFQPGGFEQTGNDLDVALEDNGENFFVVQTPQGRRFTRSGNFSLDPNGRLITAAGYSVLGENGPIVIRGGKVEIATDGTVRVDGQEVDRLLVVHFTPVNGRLPLKKEGNNLFRPQDAQSVPRITPNPRVRQGYLEASNVGLVQQMAELIRITRGFEAYQRAILVADSSLNMLIQRVGGG